MSEKQLAAIENLLRYHETGGHEGDGSDHAMRLAREAFEALRQPTPDALKMALEHIEDHTKFAETRIQDGIELGATVWRIALEDMVRESRDVLAALKDSAHDK